MGAYITFVEGYINLLSKDGNIRNNPTNVALAVSDIITVETQLAYVTRPTQLNTNFNPSNGSRSFATPTRATPTPTIPSANSTHSSPAPLHSLPGPARGSPG